MSFLSCSMGNVAFLLNGGAMSACGGTVVGGGNAAVEGIRGSWRRAWGAAVAPPVTMMGDDGGDGVGGDSGGGWNTMRFAKPLAAVLEERQAWTVIGL